MSTEGVIYRVAGPVVTATGISPKMYDVVHVGNEQLMGEVIKIVGEYSIIQVYEDTDNVKPGEPVTNTGRPLSVELGPGLLTSVYDGIHEVRRAHHNALPRKRSVCQHVQRDPRGRPRAV